MSYLKFFHHSLRKEKVFLEENSEYTKLRELKTFIYLIPEYQSFKNDFVELKLIVKKKRFSTILLYIIKRKKICPLRGHILIARFARKFERA